MNRSTLSLVRIGLLLALSGGAAAWAPAASAKDVCWRGSYGRGVGTIPTECGDANKNGALCYPKCREGYKGVGPVCWQRCPAGFRDDGAFCAKPKPYGRGAGYVIWQRKKCEKKHGRCQKKGAMWYPKCREGFHAVGCCICSPNCRDGQKDIGVSCAKKSYGRGAGDLLKCSADKEKDAGLCYRRCKAGYRGVGPVCWGKCPADYPVSCGLACGVSKKACAVGILKMIGAPFQVVANVASMVLTGGAATAAKVGAQAAAAAAKAVAKALAKKVGKKLAKGVVDRIAGELTGKAKEEKFNALAFVKSLDPTGIAEVVDAFKKPKCADLFAGPSHEASTPSPSAAPAQPAASAPAPAPFNPSQTMTVCLRDSRGSFVRVEPGGDMSSAGRACRAWELNQLMRAGDRWFIKSHFNRFWSARPDGGLAATAREPQSWEGFTLEGDVRPGGTVALRSAHRKYVSAAGGGGQGIAVDRVAANAWERFTLVAEGSEPAAAPRCGRLSSDAKLRRGESVKSCDGRLTFVHQDDGNVVAYDAARGGRPVWDSKTNGRKTTSLVMQGDGNLVLYNDSQVVWASNTEGNAGASLALQDDGNVVVYTRGGRPVWATNSNR